MHYIYLITNLVNGKIYIGQTNDPNRRWSQHKSSARRSVDTLLVTRAMIKYGAQQFTFEIISTCKTQEDVNIVEDVIIEQYGSRNPKIGYNIARGGGASFSTPEIRNKISIALKKHYANNASIRKGIPLTEEWKKRISEASMGKPGTNAGRKFSEEWIMKISKSQAGKGRECSRRFTKEQEAEICRLYKEESKTTYYLANKYDCYRSTINDILIRNGIEIRQSQYNKHSNKKNKFTPEQEAEICDLYSSGKMNRAWLAAKFGCGKTTIRDILIRNKIKL